MWRRILAYLLFGLGFLTFTFFKHYTGELIPQPFLFWRPHPMYASPSNAWVIASRQTSGRIGPRIY
jgi:hypothetical protein